MGATLQMTAGTDGSDPKKSLRDAHETGFCDVCDIALEADHRIANHLAMLSGYVGLKQGDLAHRSEPLTKAFVQLAFDGIRTQIEAVSRLHRSLATRGEGAPIDVGDYLHQICTPFMSGLSGPITILENLHPDCRVRSDQILPLTQIVSEVVTNAIKYSQARGQTGTVSVSCRNVGEAGVEIEVIDDGTGLPQLLDPRTAGGIGFRLIRALTTQLGAQSGFESSRAGTRFWLRLRSTSQRGAGS